VAIPVTIITWPSGGTTMAINELRGRAMYDLPPVGSRYWLDGEPLSVREVDASSDPVVVHLEHDEAFADEVRAVIADGYWLHGGRSSDDGRWHFYGVVDGRERFGPWFGDTLDEALGQAIAEVNARASAAS